MEEQIRYEHSSDCENYEDYCQGGYHPTYLGERINGKYTIIQKLGWGHFSTVWLVETDQPKEQFALKIQRSKESHAETAIDEIKLLQQLRKHESDKGWVNLVEDGFHIEQLKETYDHNDLHRIFRPLLLVDSFIIYGIHGKHYCSVFQLMGPNLLDVIQHYQYKDIQMPLHLVKKITRDVLIGLVYMHDYVQMIHTDLKPENILIKLSPQEQLQFVEGLRNYKVKPISMKFLHNTQAKNSSKNRKKYDKKKLKKKQNKQTNQKTEVNELEQANNEKEQVEPKTEESHKQPIQQVLTQNTEATKINEPIPSSELKDTTSVSITAEQTPVQKKKKKKSIKKKQSKAENAQADTEKEELIKTTAKQFGKKKKGSKKNPPNKLLKMASGEQSSPASASDRSSSMSQNESDNSDDFESDSKDEIKVEYTPQQLENLKWKNIYINLKKDIHFKICDFGNACMESSHFTQDIQTREYRAPEVILGHHYLPNADVWSLACVVYELLTNSFLFKPKDRKGIGKDEDHLYMMIEMLGNFPKVFALEGKNSRQYFNKKGELLHGMPKTTLSISQLLEEDYNYPKEQAKDIEQFLRPMLEYEPSKRISALECLKSKWLWI